MNSIKQKAVVATFTGSDALPNAIKMLLGYFID